VWLNIAGNSVNWAVLFWVYRFIQPVVKTTRKKVRPFIQKDQIDFTVVMFDFNGYSGLLLPAFLQGLLFAVLCFIRYGRERHLSDLFLTLLLLFLSIRVAFWMLGFAGWYDLHDGLTTFMYYFPFNTLIWVGPCFYFYFLSLTNRDFRLQKAHWPHAVLPFLLLLLYIGKFTVDFLAYRPFPATEDFQFGTHGPLAQLDKTDPVYAVAYISLAYYLALVYRSFRYYRDYLHQQVADSGRLTLGWLKALIAFVSAALLVFLAFYISGYFFQLGYKLNWYPYLLLGIVIYYISINGYYHAPTLFRFLSFEPDAPQPVKSEPLANLESWKLQLTELMDIQQPYLDNELTLIRLAQQMQLSPQLLSRIVNEGYKQNFNDYINGLRVTAVVARFQQEDHLKYSLMGLAYDCGFNSKTTFNRAFKKATGQTPSEYLENL
jgi:AraC-like DNA-binding protein